MSTIVTLNSDSPSVQYLSKRDKRLAKVISMIGPITYSPHDTDPYSHMVHEIIEQMLSVKAGARIYDRLVDLCGGTLTPEAISSIDDASIRECGTSNAKVSYIRNLTDAVLSESIVFDDFLSMTDEEVLERLTQLRGIGSWTAKMYLIFVLDRPDILPYEDGAFLQSYKWLYKTDDVSPTSIKKRCKKWKPYSSIAARYLYRALDYGLTKEEFHLFKK